jgi:hypothetical protein
MPHLRADRLATLGAAALIPLSLAVTAAAHPVAAHAASGQTITVTEHANTDTEVPAAPGGKDVKGDPLTFVNPVFNAADTKQVGHDEGFCTRSTAASSTASPSS